MLVPVIHRTRLLEELQPLPRLVRIIAPAGYGKTTLARALLARAGSAAVCDLAYVRSPVDLLRSAIEAVVSADDEERRRAIADQFLALGDDAALWLRFAQQFLRELREPRVLCFENGETIKDRPALRETMEALLRQAYDALSVIGCTRVPIDLQLGRFAGPDVTRIINAEDLRFDRDEIRAIFDGTALSKATLERIEEYTGGWPIVVMMLHQLARRGRLREYLIGKRDETDLYGYLAGEVYAELTDAERSICEALAAIPDATERDLAALFTDYASTLASLEAQTPFVSRTRAGTIEIHPAMREMLAGRGDAAAILERLMGALPRDDGGLRAAQIAMQLGRPRDAARALVDVQGGYWLATPGPEVVSILSAIPSDVIVGFPHLWSVATIARCLCRDPILWIDEGERVYTACDAATPDSVRAGVASSLMNAYLNRGRWNDVDAFGQRLVDEASPSFRPLAQEIAAMWRFGADSYRGRAVDLSLLDTRFATFMADPTARSLCMYDVVARDHRIRGDRVGSRAILERAIDVARSTKIPMVHFLVVMDAAFGAWFWGEDDVYARYLDELESLIVPSIERGCAHFIACARGRAARATVGYEKMKTRAYAFTIAASLERGRAQRLRYLNEAVIAADHADQPFAQVLARVALGLTERGGPREEAFDEAREIANQTCSDALREAVRRTRDGDASGTMLAALARRFSVTESASMSQTAVIDLVAGTVAIDGRDVRLSEREAQLVTLLALRGTVHADEIVDILWPESEGDRADASLRVYVSRLRRLTGDRFFIMHQPHGYQLGTPARITRGPALAARFARWGWLGAAS